MNIAETNGQFGHLPTSDLSEFKARKFVRSFKPGSFLFREGDEAKRVFQIVSGVLRVSRVTESGRRQAIAFGFPGDVVGFSNDARHNTDCDVLESAKVIPLYYDALEHGQRDDALHQHLMQAALREINNMQDHFMMVGCKTALERVASFLSALAERLGEPLGQYTRVALPMSRPDIASFLGLTTETVSRTTTQLCKWELISRENTQTLIILKPAALRALAEGAPAKTLR